MALVIMALKIYFVVVSVFLVTYSARHLLLSWNRMYSTQRTSYRDIIDSDMPLVSVLVPMHNEELVLKNCLDALVNCDYDKDRMEVIPINDHSEDRTGELLNGYYAKYPFIKPLHRLSQIDRGKPVGLNDAMAIAKGEIIIVFDADYRPSKNLIRKLVLAFEDPEVGAVMGRVIPVNAHTNLLTELLNLERTGGYQVDQQARYNLGLMPLYGGTVGGFRKELILKSGGFDTRVLAEDTELTYRLYTKGYKVVYDNSAECYEESPETWAVRGKQIRRWSRGHNEVMFKHFFRLLFSPYLSFRERVDGMFLLLIYLMPFLTGVANLACLVLFFSGEMLAFTGFAVMLMLGMYSAWGNFAPFYEIVAGALLDGMKKEIMVLPLICLSFYFYMWHISLGFVDAVIDRLSDRKVEWEKTVRFAGEQTAEGEAGA